MHNTNCGSGAGHIDRYLGSSFDIVYAVYKELDKLPYILEFIIEYTPKMDLIIDQNAYIISKIEMIEVNSASAQDSAERAELAATRAETQAIRSETEAETSQTQAAIATTQANISVVEAGKALVQADRSLAEANRAKIEADNAQVRANTSLNEAERSTLQANRAETEADRSETQALRAISEAIIATNQAVISTNQAATATTEATKAKNQADTSILEAGRALTQANRAESEATVAIAQATIATTQANRAETLVDEFFGELSDPLGSQKVGFKSWTVLDELNRILIDLEALRDTTDGVYSIVPRNDSGQATSATFAVFDTKTDALTTLVDENNAPLANPTTTNQEFKFKCAPGRYELRITKNSNTETRLIEFNDAYVREDLTTLINQKANSNDPRFFNTSTWFKSFGAVANQSAALTYLGLNTVASQIQALEGQVASLESDLLTKEGQINDLLNRVAALETP